MERGVSDVESRASFARSCDTNKNGAVSLRFFRYVEHGTEKHNAPLGALARHGKLISLQIDLINVKLRRLRYAQSRRKQQFQNRSVAQSHHILTFGRIEQA